MFEGISPSINGICYGRKLNVDAAPNKDCSFNGGGDGDGKVAHVMVFGNLSSRFVGKSVNFTASCFHWTRLRRASLARLVSSSIQVLSDLSWQCNLKYSIQTSGMYCQPITSLNRSGIKFGAELNDEISRIFDNASLGQIALYL